MGGNGIICSSSTQIFQLCSGLTIKNYAKVKVLTMHNSSFQNNVNHTKGD